MVNLPRISQRGNSICMIGVDLFVLLSVYGLDIQLQ